MAKVLENHGYFPDFLSGLPKNDGANGIRCSVFLCRCVRTGRNTMETARVCRTAVSAGLPLLSDRRAAGSEASHGASDVREAGLATGLPAG